MQLAILGSRYVLEPNMLMVKKPSPLESEAQAELKARHQDVKLEDCYVYHWFDMPDGRQIVGSWDLREKWREYLGEVDLKGLRVLELGPASGFLTLKMEDMGADVVAFDLPPGVPPDILPVPSISIEQLRASKAREIDRVRNSWWYFHRQFGSTAKAAYGDIYRLPDWLGRFDVSVFAAILLHLANPFNALREAAARTEGMIIVTDLFAPHLGENAVLEFSPYTHGKDPMAWWLLTPGAITRMLTALGFSNVRLTYHEHRFHGAFKRDEFTLGKFFTIVATRE
jgi:hypothetical protein